MVDLKKNIKEFGWTQSRLAEKLGIQQGSLAVQLNNGTASLSRLQQMANAIGISVSELLHETDGCASPTCTCPHCGKPIKIKVEP